MREHSKEAMLSAHLDDEDDDDDDEIDFELKLGEFNRMKNMKNSCVNSDCNTEVTMLMDIRCN